jgi:hypothetical protein
MERHGRAAKPIDNPSVRGVLCEGERQYLTTRRHCDCGTILAPYGKPDAFQEDLEKEEARMRSKGWSQAKIARAIEGKRKADARPRRSGPDSLDLWKAVMCDLRDKLALPYAGLFVRSYSGAIATEAFNASRRELPKNVSWQDALGSLEQDELTIFPFK